MRIFLPVLLMLGSLSPQRSSPPPVSEVKGRVFNASTCGGLGGMVVKFMPPISDQLQQSQSVVPRAIVTATTNDGTFEVAVIPGEYYVTVSQGAEQLYGRVVSVTSGTPVLIGLVGKG